MTGLAHHRVITSVHLATLCNLDGQGCRPGMQGRSAEQRAGLSIAGGRFGDWQAHRGRQKSGDRFQYRAGNSRLQLLRLRAKVTEQINQAVDETLATGLSHTWLCDRRGNFNCRLHRRVRSLHRELPRPGPGRQLGAQQPAHRGPGRSGTLRRVASGRAQQPQFHPPGTLNSHSFRVPSNIPAPSSCSQDGPPRVGSSPAQRTQALARLDPLGAGLNLQVRREAYCLSEALRPRPPHLYKTGTLVPGEEPSSQSDVLDSEASEAEGFFDQLTVAAPRVSRRRPRSPHPVLPVPEPGPELRSEPIRALTSPKFNSIAEHHGNRRTATHQAWSAEREAARLPSLALPRRPRRTAMPRFTLMLTPAASSDTFI